MTFVSPIPQPASGTLATSFADTRNAIDMIANCRAKTIRVALFANYLFRPHPTQPEDEATRESWRVIIKEQLDDMAHICNLVNGHDPSGVVAPDIARWIGDQGARHPKSVAAFERTRQLTQELVDATQSEDMAAIEKALDAHKAYGRSGFAETVAKFCDILWAELDDTRDREVENATAAAAAITKTLQRLEHIGKHVRLVSLNASVEAARVGDAGRGLGVIAVEFKTLAEEIQRLATTARSDVAAMGQSSDKAPKFSFALKP